MFEQQYVRVMTHYSWRHASHTRNFIPIELIFQVMLIARALGLHISLGSYRIELSTTVREHDSSVSKI